MRRDGPVGRSDAAPGYLADVMSILPARHSSWKDTIPVSTPLLTLLHALEEAAGEEGHGHEQDDGTAHNGGDHCHLEAEGLMGWHSCKGKTTAPGTADPDLLGPGC